MASAQMPSQEPADSLDGWGDTILLSDKHLQFKLPSKKLSATKLEN
jgi:hypothetical protein